MNDLPYGYDCQIQLNAGMARTETVWRHFTGSHSDVQRKCMRVSRAQKVLQMKPLTREQWNHAYGDPACRSRFA
jgi:hypothetical protein